MFSIFVPIKGILETAIVFTVLYFLMNIIVFLFAKILHKKSLLHETFKLFIASLVLQFLSYLFIMSDLAQFSSSGVETSGMQTLG